MKAKLFVGLLLFGLGAYSPDLRQHAVDWWHAAPSSEAQKLIASLEAANGWSIGKTQGGVGRGGVYIKPGVVEADIHVGENDLVWADVSGSFSHAERRAINQAADSCRRKLLAGSIGQKTVTDQDASENRQGKGLITKFHLMP